MILPMFKHLIDRLTYANVAATLALFISLGGVSYAAITVLSLLQNYVLNTLGQKVVNNMRWKVYGHTMNLQSSFIERMTTGRILSRLTNDVGNTQWLMVWGLPSLIVNVLTLIGIAIILFVLDAGLAVFVLIPVPFIGGIGAGICPGVSTLGGSTASPTFTPPPMRVTR